MVGQQCQIAGQKGAFGLLIEVRQIRSQSGALQPVDYRLMRSERMKIGGAPDINFTALTGEQIVPGVRRKQGLAAAVRHSQLAGDLTHQSMGGLLPVIRHLHRQRTVIRQLIHQMRKQRLMIRQPLQRVVGIDHVWRLRRPPAGDIGLDELTVG